MKMYSSSFVTVSSVGPLQRAVLVVLVFHLDVTGVCYVCCSTFEPSSEYAIFTVIIQHFVVRWMKIPLKAWQCFLECIDGCLNFTLSQSCQGERSNSA